MIKITEVAKYFDEEGRLKIWPSKHSVQSRVLEVLARDFELDKLYSEKEVNEIIKASHTFNDICLLRRELIDRRFMKRDKYGTEYEKLGIGDGSYGEKKWNNYGPSPSGIRVVKSDRFHWMYDILFRR